MPVAAVGEVAAGGDAVFPRLVLVLALRLD
jgi:hypothetical protein